MVADGELLEWAEIFGHRSGTPARPSATSDGEGRDVAARDRRAGRGMSGSRCPDAVLIFLVPPSLQELERRLRGRGPPRTRSELARRLASRRGGDCAQAEWFDHVVVNDDAGRARDEVAAIIEASRTTATCRSAALMIEPKIDDLLATVDSKYTAGDPRGQARAGDQLLLQPAR